jgi:hypothetical protein
VSTPSKAAVEAGKILGATHHQVLLLEGPDDVAVYSKWLQRLAAPGTLFTAKVRVVDGGGKLSVLATLEWFRDQGGNPNRLYGLVDRDEWDAPTITTWTQALPQLRVNPHRHALESYFCDPGEIGPAVLALNPAHGPRIPALQAQILGRLPERADHWALFTVTERVKERMNAAQYPGVFRNQYQLPPDTDIRQRLRGWVTILDADALFAEFDQLRAMARALPESDQCRRAVWAADFYQQVVYDGADGLRSLDQKSLRAWMVDLAEFAPAAPGDIAAILQPLLL